MDKTLSDFPENFDAEAYRQDAEKLGEQVAEYVKKGYAERLQKADINIRRAFDERYSALKYQLQFGVIDQETYFEKLASLRDRYFSKSTQEWYKYTAEIYDYKQEMLENYEKAVTGRIESTIAEINRARNAYSNALETGFGTETGYDTKTTKVHNYYPNGATWVFTDYSLSDLDKEIEKMRAFDETLEKLAERANTLDAEHLKLFFEKLRELPVEDADRLANLLLAGDEKTFVEYLSAFGERHELAESIAEKLYAPEYSKIAETMRTEMEGIYAEIPEDFFVYGEGAAESFTEGFLSGIGDLFSNVEWNFNIGHVPAGAMYAARSFSPTYNLYGSGETVSEQLISARNAAIIEAMRMGE